MGSDEFTVHLISTASMDYFPDNTLASFRNFCKEEIALDGDWRVALSEIIFPTPIGIQFPDLTMAKKFLSNQESTLL